MYRRRHRLIPNRCLPLQNLILQAQPNAEYECLTTRSGPGWFISDRSGANPIAFALAYVGNEDKARSLVDSENWMELHDRMASSLIVVCEAGMSWLTDDGVRLMPRDRDEWVGFHWLFCRFLDKQGLPYMILPSVLVDIKERVGVVVTEWQKRDNIFGPESNRKSQECPYPDHLITCDWQIV